MHIGEKIKDSSERLKAAMEAAIQADASGAAAPRFLWQMAVQGMQQHNSCEPQLARIADGVHSVFSFPVWQTGRPWWCARPLSSLAAL